MHTLKNSQETVSVLFVGREVVKSNTKSWGVLVICGRGKAKGNGKRKGKAEGEGKELKSLYYLHWGRLLIKCHDEVNSFFFGKYL